MQTFQITTTVKLITMECSVCGTIFAISEEKDRRALDAGDRFCCPNGHWQVYRETEVTRLRHRLDQREAELESAYRHLDETRNDLKIKKRLVTRMEKRVHAGVCIECHRHFENLERHMKTKHGKL
ncbi:hypothetical protein ES703_04105 [subsurface metagenome]